MGLKYEKPENLNRVVLTDPVHFIAFGFGSGLMPIAPGTWASLFTAVAFWFLPEMSTTLILALTGILFLFGIWVCGESSRRLKVHDFQGIVFDEVVGMLATLSVVIHDPVWIIVAFVFFRIADIWKPWPIRDVDHSLTGGLGIMLDDLLAAVYAALATFSMQYLFTVI
jgi:phosphatidylglycerophosphatase A